MVLCSPPLASVIPPAQLGDWYCFIHKAAKQAFDELQITKLPSMQSLYEEFHQLAVQKKQDYAEYRQIRKEKEELLIAKRTVETILNIDRQKEQEKEQEKEQKKNFR